MARQPSTQELPPPLELACLNILWSMGSANVKEVREALLPGRSLAYTTVMTLLDRLDKRGLATREKQGRSFHYRPTITREHMQRIAVLQLVDRLFDGSPDELRRFLGVGPATAAHSHANPNPDAGSLDAALL